MKRKKQPLGHPVLAKLAHSFSVRAFPEQAARYLKIVVAFAFLWESRSLYPVSYLDMYQYSHYSETHSPGFIQIVQTLYESGTIIPQSVFADLR